MHKDFNHKVKNGDFKQMSEISQLSTIPLENYKRKCEKLKRDLHNIIEDIKFEGDIFYAVDYCEIYAYLYSAKTANELALFDIEEIKERSAIQNQALENLFFKNEQVVLLRPYALELEEGVTARLKIEAKQEYQSDYPFQIDREIKNIFKDKFCQELYHKLEKNQNLNDEELNWLDDFLAKNAKLLITIYSRQDENPFLQLKKLLDKSVFTDLDELSDSLGLQEDFKILDDEQEISQILHLKERVLKLKKLLCEERNKKRKHKLCKTSEELEDEGDDDIDNDEDVSNEAIFNDAVAIMAVEQANEILLKQDKMLLLVTRSESMHKVIEKELKKQKKDDKSNKIDKKQKKKLNYLRHPRMFANIFNVNEDLSSYLTTVSAFIKSVESTQTNGEDDKQNCNYPERGKDHIINLQDQMQEIEAKWKNLLQTALVSQVDSSTTEDYFYSQPSLKKDEKTILEFLHFSKNNKAIQDRLAERRLRFAELWKSALQNFGFKLQVFKHQNQCDFEIETFSDNNQHMLLANAAVSSATFYTLHFYSEDAKKYLESIKHSQRKFSVLDIIESLSSGTDNSSLNISADYERILAMTFLLGISEEWEIAGMYSQISIDTANKRKSLKDINQKKPFVEPSEAYYFSAICIRKTCKRKKQKEYQNFLKAINYVDTAIKLRNKAISSNKNIVKPSPRYLHEKGLLILIITNRFPDQRDYTAKQGLDYLKQAERLAISNHNFKLAILIQNNRLYHYVEKYDSQVSNEQFINKLSEQDNINFKELIANLESLVLEKLGEDKNNWPLPVLDTIIYSKYLFLGQSDKSISILEQRIKTERCFDNEASEIQEHLFKMKDSK